MKTTDKRFNINDLDVMSITDHEYVKDKFILTLTKIHGVSLDEADAIYNRESIYFKKAVSGTKDLKECTSISLFSTFLDIAISNISIAPGGKSESFIEHRSGKMIVVEKEKRLVNGVEQEIDVSKEKWIKSARLVLTAYGELSIRIRSGQIIRMSNPIVVYEGDRFQPRTNDRGILVVEYEPSIPRKSNNIIACWVAIHLPNNGLDFKWLVKEDIDRLAGYATKKTSKGEEYTSALYTSNSGQIDPGFLEAKTIRHAMRSYGRVKVNSSISIEDDEEPIVQQESFAKTDDLKRNKSVKIETEESEEDDIF